MSRSPNRETDYAKFAQMMKALLDNHEGLVALEGALGLVSRCALALACEVGVVQRVSGTESSLSSNPRISRLHQNLRVALKCLRQAVRMMSEELAQVVPLVDHPLDPDDLFEGAIESGAQAHWIERMLGACGLEKLTHDKLPKSLVYAVMVGIGKRLKVGYDVQARVLAPVIHAHYDSLSPSARGRKLRTLETELKRAHQSRVDIDADHWMALLPVVTTLAQRFGAPSGPLR